MKDERNLKLARGQKEDGVVVGNIFDKYGSPNPLVRLFIRGFMTALDKLVEKVNPARIHEVGCGEGFWTLHWMQKGRKAFGSDFSGIVIGMARSNAEARGLPAQNFRVGDIYHPDPSTDKADLVVCCEVLEHLERPLEALKALEGIASPWLIACVPREPLWRILNVLRGKYWRHRGNTPGHLQHWSKRGFIALVSPCFEITEVVSPLPWTMILCRKRDKG